MLVSTHTHTNPYARNANAIQITPCSFFSENIEKTTATKGDHKGVRFKIRSFCSNDRFFLLYSP